MDKIRQGFFGLKGFEGGPEAGQLALADAGRLILIHPAQSC